MVQTFAQFERKLEAVAKEFDGGGGRQRLARVGKLTEGDVDEAVRSTLGDLSMSGWTRSNPIDVKGVSRVVGDSAVFISAGKASGPMRVLQSGRNQGGGSHGIQGPGVSRDGTTRRTKAGNVVKVRARKGYALGKVGRQWNGRTQGKGTWDAAAALMAERVPARVAKEVHNALGKHLREG